MRLGRLDMPCGCEGRKEIIFTHGRVGVAEAAILTGVLVVIILAWRVNT